MFGRKACLKKLCITRVNQRNFIRIVVLQNRMIMKICAESIKSVYKEEITLNAIASRYDKRLAIFCIQNTKRSAQKTIGGQFIVAINFLKKHLQITTEMLYLYK